MLADNDTILSVIKPVIEVTMKGSNVAEASMTPPLHTFARTTTHDTTTLFYNMNSQTAEVIGFEKVVTPFLVCSDLFYYPYKRTITPQKNISQPSKKYIAGFI